MKVERRIQTSCKQPTPLDTEVAAEQEVGQRDPQKPIENTAAHVPEDPLFSLGPRSQCSHPARGRRETMGFVLKASEASKKKEGKKRRSGNEEKKSKPIDHKKTALKNLKQGQPGSFQKQVWADRNQVMLYACGDGVGCVFVVSDKTVETAPSKPFETTFRKEVAEDFVDSKTKPVQGKQLFREVKQVFDDYLYYEDPRVSCLLTAWTLGTYCYSVFDYFGYLFFHSEKYRCGKTRNLELLSNLAYEASDVLGSSTAPSIREMASEGGTLVLDTLERWKEKSRESFAAAMELLDAGFRNNGQVSKMVKSARGKWTNEKIPVYCPYSLAGINKRSLSETAIDRSFPIEMKRKPRSETRKRFISRQVEERCSSLRDECYLWGLESAVPVEKSYSSSSLNDRVTKMGLNDRAHDIWMPLFAVMEGLGFSESSSEWIELRDLAISMHLSPEIEADQLELSIIKCLKSLIGKGQVIKKMTSQLVEEVRNAGLEVQEKDLRGLLIEWGFTKKPSRINGKPRKAWVIDVQVLNREEQRVCDLLSSYPHLPTTLTTGSDPEVKKSSVNDSDADSSVKPEALEGGDTK